MINEQEIRKAISILKPNNQLFEVRVINKDGYISSGYFDNADKLIELLNNRPNIDNETIYFTLQHLDSAVKSREQYGKFVSTKGKTPTTSDNDIIGYNYLFIDIDPKRISGTSSSDEELQKAKELGNKLYSFMLNVGFNKPVIAESGNGVHLLYRVSLKNTKENTELVKNCLKTLDMFLSTDDIKIDCSNFNPARICKLYGTMANKGRDSEERPHRLAKTVFVPDEIKVTDIDYLKKLVDMQPKVEKPQKYNNYSPSSFDVEEWMNKNGLNYKKSSFSDGIKYILDCCPFNSNHRGKDACVFRRNDNSLSFHCFHNECSSRGWKDVRLLFEPDAYEKKNQEYEKRIYHSFNRDKKEVTPIVKQEGKPIFYSPMDVYSMPKAEESFVRTGILDIDKKMRGLKKGYVSVVSGLRAAAKSSVLSEIALNAANDGNNVGVFSGELTAQNFMKWMYLQAAGKSYVVETQYTNYYTVPRDIQKEIATWLNEHLWLYNNDYGNNFEAILEEFEKCINDKKLDLLILDNLMAFNISSLADTKWDAQTQFVLKLQKLAKEKNVAIIFVAHPRKALGFLRLDDISGTGDLANAVDNAFIVHRVNNDFKRLSKQMFGWNEQAPIYGSTNCIEIAKDRDGGICDYFIPLFYEIETKRLKNYPSENVIYGWNQKDNGFSQAGIEEYVPF